MAGTKLEYSADKTGVCLSVLLEVVAILGAYRGSVAIVGGWVPYFLVPARASRHVGSTDVDLALDFASITDDNYASIRKLLEEHGYEQAKDHPYKFVRTLADPSGRDVQVSVDLLAGEYGGTGGSHRSQMVQDVRAHKARGCDLVFDSMLPVTVRGQMPNGATNEVTINVAGVVPFLVMKANALWERLKAKDAYDIYFIVSEYPGALAALVEAFRPFSANKLVLEGLGKIRAKFSGVDSLGPTSVAEFLEEYDADERERIHRDVFERINALLDAMEIVPFEEG